MAETRIVGITLVRDEEFFVEQAVRNALAFCDEVIALEHASIDATPQILAALAAQDDRLRVHAVAHPRESHDFIAGYAGHDVWIAGFDGDQLFDPAGLASTRERILAGALAGVWAVAGRTLNCVALDRAAGTAQGYLGPPSRGTPKLLNFAAIDAWDGPTPERLHGGVIRFRSPYNDRQRDTTFQTRDWDDTPFRWLHLCFVRRSSRRRETIRRNPAEEAWSSLDRLRHRVGRLVGRRPATETKAEAYSHGPLVSVDARPFFQER